MVLLMRAPQARAYRRIYERAHGTLSPMPCHLPFAQGTGARDVHVGGDVIERREGFRILFPATQPVQDERGVRACVGGWEGLELAA